MLWPEHDDCGESDGGEEEPWASVVACCDASPVLKPPVHDLDPVAAFIMALVVLDLLAARLPAGDAGLYPLVFQRFPVPIGIIAPVGQQPVHLWQAAEPCRRTGVITDAACRHKEPERAPQASVTACDLVFIPPLVRPIKRPLWSLGPPF